MQSRFDDRILVQCAAEMNRAFAAFLRLIEIQDTLNQISRLNCKTLIGYSDLPEFVSAQLSSRSMVDDTLRSTESALERFVCLGEPYG